MKISEINKLRAENNIINKIGILNFLATPEGLSFLKSGIYYPKSLRQFNLWETTCHPHTPSIKAVSKNANDTLRNYLHYRNEALILINKLNLLNSKPNSKPEKIAVLNERIKEQKQYIETLEIFTSSQQIKIKELTSLYESETKRLNNIINEIKKGRPQT